MLQRIALVCGGLMVVGLACGDDDKDSNENPQVETVVLEAYPAAGCTTTAAISPIIPDEIGHFAATRFTPSAYPFTVTTVAYDLSEQDVGTCDTSLAHAVEIYVTDAAAPAASPATDGTLVATLNVPADSSAGAERAVLLDLDNDIVLTTGQHIYVAVKMSGNGDNTGSVCIQACADANSGEAGETWWSNAAAQPYAWADMTADFGFDIAYAARVLGHE